MTTYVINPMQIVTSLIAIAALGALTASTVFTGQISVALRDISPKLNTLDSISNAVRGIANNENSAPLPILAPAEYDVSGTGNCTQIGGRITISGYTHTVWAQSPRSVEKTVPITSVDFTGKNGIVMRGRNHQLVTVASTPDGVNSFVVDVEGSSDVFDGICDFTLDPVVRYSIAPVAPQYLCNPMSSQCTRAGSIELYVLESNPWRKSMSDCNEYCDTHSWQPQTGWKVGYTLHRGTNLRSYTSNNIVISVSSFDTCKTACGIEYPNGFCVFQENGCWSASKDDDSAEIGNANINRITFWAYCLVGSAECS